MASRLLNGPAARLYGLLVVVVVGFCAGLLLSARMWIGPRSYPLAPVSSLLPPIDVWLAYGLFAALFVLAGAILVVRKPQRCIAGFLAIIAGFCLLDQTRWQPWVFLYGALLAILALFSWDDADEGGRRTALDAARLVVAFTYIFSGLQKVNVHFMQSDFPWIVQPVVALVPATARLVPVLAAAAPFVQVAFGIGLLTRRFRRISLVAAVAMHVFILSMFGPFGLDWNAVVWPWTAAMGILDVVLFAGYHGAFGELFGTAWQPQRVTVLVAFLVLPALSFVNLWDSYLSAALYSGNLTEAEIYTNDAGRASLPAPLGKMFVHTAEDTNVLNVQRWAIEDLNVTPYPETRVYKAIARPVCSKLREQSQLVVIIREQRMFFSKPEAGYRCWQV